MTKKERDEADPVVFLHLDVSSIYYVPVRHLYSDIQLKSLN